MLPRKAKVTGKKDAVQKKQVQRASKADSPTVGRKRKFAMPPKAPNYTGWSAAMLKSECNRRHLDTSGTKAVLCHRLQQPEHDNNNDLTVAKVPKSGPLSPSQQTMDVALMGIRKIAKVDPKYPDLASVNLVDDYRCMLSCTNIVNDCEVTKYYLIQLLYNIENHDYLVWTRAGQLGNPHEQLQTLGPFADRLDAVRVFMDKFFDKSGTHWADRHDFRAVKGMYRLVAGEDDEDKLVVAVDEGRLHVYAECKLDDQTKMFVRFIFDKDMFNKAMSLMNFDVSKMPLGLLSKSQIAKGFEILREIQQTIGDGDEGGQLLALTSKFYSQVPHLFGKKRPLAIKTKEDVQEKIDNLIVLSDIEMAQALQLSGDTLKAIACKDATLPPHPLDIQYKLMECDLTLLDERSLEFKMINDYVNATKGLQFNKVKNIWKMDRYPESARYKKFDDVQQRKLLWHGTNVATSVAICKDGLRILPNSGGHFGRAISFASENAKSSALVRAIDKTGVMFLTEVALGRQHFITADDWSLRTAPDGYDSIVARGQTEPDSKEDVTMQMDGHDVVIPSGSAVACKTYRGSAFDQSEYLVYDETRVRMRYLLQMEWKT